MPFDPQDFLRFAQALVGDPAQGEPGLRSAVSRAYYAVHLHARESLISSGGFQATHTGADHQAVIAGIRARGGPAGDQIDWLRVRRIRADYRLQSSVANQAQQAVAVAEAIWPRI